MALSERQIALKTLIHINSLVENRKTTQKEIVDKVSGYEWNDNPKVHDHCSQIWHDINAINMNVVKAKTKGFIIIKNFEYWIGSEEETKKYRDTLMERMKPLLARYWLLSKYIEENGKYDLFEETFKELFKVDISEVAYEEKSK